MTVNIDYSHMTSFPDILENPPLYSVVVGIGSYIQEATKEIAKVVVPVAGTRMVPIEFADAVNLLTVVTGATHVSSKHYTGYSEVTISGNGTATIVINGNPLTRIEQMHEKVYGRTGEILPFENVLCTNEMTAGLIASLVGDFYVTRSIYSADYNGHILIDPMDRILTQNDFEETMPSMVIANTIEYNGAWKGKLKWSR